MNQQTKEYQIKDDKKNNSKTTNSQINIGVEKQLSKIYQQQNDNTLLCKSCQLDITKQNIYIHLFDPKHILKLQEQFIIQNCNTFNDKEKILKKIESKNEFKQSKQIFKGHKQMIKNQLKNEELNQNIYMNKNQIQKFIEIFQNDLKSVGKIQLSLIVSILVKTYCNINDILEMKFSQIIDKFTSYHFSINSTWEKNYLIQKQKFPDYLQEYINQNIGSNKQLIKLLGQNKRQYLSKELWLSCKKIISQTNDLEYIGFLQGLTLKKLKKISLDKMTKYQPIQTQDELINQNNQFKITDQNVENVKETQNSQKKQLIKIIIKQKLTENQKQKLVD